MVVIILIAFIAGATVLIEVGAIPNFNKGGLSGNAVFGYAGLANLPVIVGLNGSEYYAQIRDSGYLLTSDDDAGKVLTIALENTTSGVNINSGLYICKSGFIIPNGKGIVGEGIDFEGNKGTILYINYDDSDGFLINTNESQQNYNVYVKNLQIRRGEGYNGVGGIRLIASQWGTIDNVEFAYLNGTSYMVENSHNFDDSNNVIKNSKIFGGTGTGIIINDNDNQALDNIIDISVAENAYAIWVNGSANRIEGNHLIGCAIGDINENIDLAISSYSTNCRVTDNYLDNAKILLQLSGNNNRISENFFNLGTTIQLQILGTGNKINDNNFIGTYNLALTLESGSSGNWLTNNDYQPNENSNYGIFQTGTELNYLNSETVSGVWDIPIHTGIGSQLIAHNTLNGTSYIP